MPILGLSCFFFDDTASSVETTTCADAVREALVAAILAACQIQLCATLVCAFFLFARIR